MSSNVQYTSGEIYLNGAKLGQSQSIKISRQTRAQQVDTLALGLAGFSPGAKMMTISVENAVPSADFEVNPGQFMTNLQNVEITIFAAGRTLTSTGIIMDDSFSLAVNSPSQLSFDFTGQYADWT